MLFPYNMRSESFSASRRWTSDNAGITAGELYEILDSPPVFRLRYMDVLFLVICLFFVKSVSYFSIPFRYGWFSNIHPESTGIFCASLGGTSKSNNTEKACNSFQSIAGCLKEQLNVGYQEIRNLSDVHNAADLALTRQTSVAVPTDHVVNPMFSFLGKIFLL